MVKKKKKKIKKDSTRYWSLPPLFVPLHQPSLAFYSVVNWIKELIHLKSNLEKEVVFQVDQFLCQIPVYTQQTAAK